MSIRFEFNLFISCIEIRLRYVVYVIILKRNAQNVLSFIYIFP